MKKGFVFLETIVMLIITTVTLVGIFKMYTKVSIEIDRRVHYDNVSDLYKTNILRSLVSLEKITSNTLIEANNCEVYMGEECAKVIEKLGVEKIYLIKDSTQKEDLPNSLIEYMKTIQSNGTYIIVNYKDNYYASLKVRGGE